jgi:hypothetical protein
LILHASESQLGVLKDVLRKIELSSGLIVNYHKSCLLPINIDNDKAGELANIFGCSVGVFPSPTLDCQWGLLNLK